MIRDQFIKEKGVVVTPRFYIQPYSNMHVRIMIVENCTYEAQAHINELFPIMNFSEHVLAMVHAHFIKDIGREMVLVFNADHFKIPLTVDCIAHEAVHAKNIIFENIGHENGIEIGTDEPEAYLVGYLTHIVFDLFVRTGNLDKITFKYNEQHY